MRQVYLEILRAWEQADDPEVQEHLHRARRDVLAMLEGQAPPEGEDYGPWKSQMEDLLYTFEQSGTVIAQQYLAKMLDEEEVWPAILLDKAVAPDGRPWVEVLKEQWKAEWEAWEEQECRAAAERRMRERLSRTTGDSMADEIMTM